MGKNDNTITISFKLDTYDDFILLKSMLQQNGVFIRRLKENTKRNTVTWDDVGRYLVKLSQFAEKDGFASSNAIKYMRME